MSTSWRFLSGSWLKLRPDQVVWLRPRRKAGVIIEVTVAEVLVDRLDGNGAGIRDPDGKEWRRFDWDLSTSAPEVAEGMGVPEISTRMPSRRRGVVLTQQQLVVVSMYANGATVAEAAAVLGLSRWTAYSYLVQAKRQYADHGYDVSTKQKLLDEIGRETPALGTYYTVTRPARVGLS